MFWKEFFQEKRNKIELTITLLLFVLILISLTRFLNFIEARSGVALSDPILNLFNPVDFTWLTFALIYISIFTAIINLIKNPERLLFTIQLYIIMVIVRMAAMYLVPLEPPVSMIILNDPLVEFFGTGRTLTKDLFFSGHTATLFILYLVSEKKFTKIFFLFCTITVAVSVILQHVHYTIDIFAAVFFTYAAHEILKSIRNKLNKNLKE